jgi:hypothetical protein
MQGIYNYIPETNHVSRVYTVTAILQLQFIVHVILLLMLNVFYEYITLVAAFWSMCTVLNRAVFFSSLISCFPGMLLRYFLNYFEMVSVAHIITAITFVFTFHMHFTF